MNPTQRFTDTVKDYVKYRPSYPDALMLLLKQQYGLNAESIVADVGSGTGIFTQLLLDEGCQVYAVEPNEAMRNSAVEQLGGNSRFISVDGQAEATGLSNLSVDWITMATAFHWVDQVKTRKEFFRISKPGAKIALIWNVRDTKVDPFMKAYHELLLKYSKEYAKVAVEHYDYTQIERFFEPNGYQEHNFEYKQSFDFDGVKGRLGSTSYAIKPGQPNYEQMLVDLKMIFDQHQQHGKIDFIYRTVAYIGQLRA